MMISDRHLTIGWFSSAVFSVLLPLTMFTIARLTNTQQNDDGGQNNDNNNYNYQNKCKWYQWNCSNQYNGNGNQDQQNEEEENGTPWWWLWSEDERRRDEDVNPTLVVIYVWSLLLFASLVYYGYRVQKSGTDDMRIIISALIIFANFTFLGMLFLGGLEGGVQDDGPELEENGFYGQFGVLIFGTYFWWTIFSAVFAYILRRRSVMAVTTRIEIDHTDYKSYESPEVSAAKKETV